MGYRGGHTVRHGPHHHNNGYNGHNNNNNSHYNSNNKSMMDQQMVAAEQTICFCFRFLNPLGNYFGNGLVSSSLQHYCRVCNIQLNSCRQAKIHSEGKKHEKRLAYLKLCIESSGDVPGSMQAACPPLSLPPPPCSATTMSMVPTSMTTTAMGPPPSSSVTVSATLPPPPQQQQLSPVTTTAIYSYQPTALTYQTCSPTLQPPPMATMQAPPPTTYYYPQTTFHSMPPQQQQQPTYHTGYHDYLTATMQPPPPLQTMQSLQSMPPPVTTTTLMSIAPPTMMVSSGHPGMLQHHQQQQPQQQQQQHGVMSPSLTSGFSGSGDCKSTETSSILSAASYSSVGAVATVVSDGGYLSRKGYTGYDNMEGGQDGYYYNNHHNYYSGHMQAAPPHNTNNNVPNSNNVNGVVTTASSTTVGRNSSFCDVCQMSFPSSAVLENHVKGSRHARKVKSQQAFRQLKESGTNFHQDEESGGEIRCEVCQVSVNSSQQLQAHLIGHKHRVRAVRRGVKPNQAMLSPSSSTATSTSTSELSFVTNGNNNNNNNNHVKNNNNNNKHQLLTATGSSSNTVVAETSLQQGHPRTRRTSSGATLSRHRSSGCLSRHCHSTLSLSRAKSSSALNKVRSRSMNLLVMRSTGDDTSSSTSSDECDADVSRRGGAKRRSHQQQNGRPRSFSVRTASITKEEKKSEAFKELSSSKVEPLPTTPTNKGNLKKVVSSEFAKKNANNVNKESRNQLEQQSNKHIIQQHHHVHHNNNNNLSKNNKTRSFVPPPPGSEWSKPRRTSVGNALKDVPMLDVFLERLKPSYNKSRNNNNNNNNSKNKPADEGKKEISMA